LTLIRSRRAVGQGRGGGQVGGGLPQGPLAADRLLLEPEEPDEAGHHQHQQRHPSDHDQGHVRRPAAGRLHRQHRRRRQRGTGEQRQPAGPGSGPAGGGLGQPPHRRVQGGGAPQQVDQQPAAVQRAAGVVRAPELERHVDAVAGEGDEQRGDHQAERRCPAAAAGRQPGGHRRDGQVGDRVGGGGHLAGHRQVGVADERGDQEGPRHQGGPHRHDQRVDQPGPVAAGAAQAHHQHQAGHQERVAAQVEGVGDGRDVVDVEDVLQGEEQHVGDQVAEPAASRYHTSGFEGRWRRTPTRIAATAERPTRL
jgi:hypothetical protein